MTASESKRLRIDDLVKFEACTLCRSECLMACTHYPAKAKRLWDFRSAARAQRRVAAVRAVLARVAEIR